MKNVLLKITALVTVAVCQLACDNESADPNLVLDEVLIPSGYIQAETEDLGTQTMLEEFRLKQPDDLFYYLKRSNGPAETFDEIIFPQKELLIEYVYSESDRTDGKTQKYHGVIVKRIRGDWRDEAFKVFDSPAQPEGGMQGLYTSLSENLEYPESAKKAGIEGKVFLEFVVAKNGELKDIVVRKGISPECDAEAVRALKTVTKWKPAMVADVPVDVKMILPITYKLG